MSSRNARLTGSEAEAAALISGSLFKAKGASKKCRSAALLVRGIKKDLAKEPKIRIDYISVVDPENLRGLKAVTGKAVIAVAAYIGRTRLIDNVGV